MNLRISPEHIRFRISADEFVTLRTVGLLENNIRFSSTAQLEYALRATSAATSSEGQTLELVSKSTPHLTRLELTVFARGIELLQSGQVDKEGLEEHQEGTTGELLTIGLEIDLHSKKKSTPS